MEFRDVVRARRMVRTYDPDRPVPVAVLDELLALATRAPSAGNTQGWAFLVLDDQASREQFWVATAGSGGADRWLRGMQTAPVLIVCLADKEAYLSRYAEQDKGWVDRDESRWPVPYWTVDTGMAALLILLGAVDAGLGGCFFGVPSERWPDVRTTFGVPQRLIPVGVVSLGYPAADVRSPSLRRGRRPLDQVVHRGRFTTPLQTDRST